LTTSSNQVNIILNQKHYFKTKTFVAVVVAVAVAVAVA
jgi:hypothetical protein